MLRVVDGKTEVYFHLADVQRGGSVELIFSLELYLLLADETLRVKLLEEAVRVKLPKRPKRWRARVRKSAEE